MKILIAEDEATTRVILKSALEGLGHEVVECLTGKDVQGHLFQGSLPQLLFLDWMMPGATGLELCESIRKRHDLPYTYIIVVTAKSKSDDILACLRAGADDYIAKPLRPEDLQARLQVATQMIDLSNLVTRQRLNLISSSKMAVLGEMASGIAHEINNPLAVIMGHADRIKETLSEDKNASSVERLAFSSDKIISMTTRISKIIMSLKTFAGDGEKEPAHPINVGALLEDALSFCETKIKGNGIAIELGQFSKDLTFEGRSIQICQVLLNLLSNAFLAVKDFDKKWIKIEVAEDSNKVFIAVSDSGPGIPEHIRAKIMQPFFTTRPTGVGTGLGLSISKGIVDAHGGELTLDTNALNTRFVITLPKRSQEEEKQAA